MPEQQPQSNKPSRLKIIYKALQELGLGQLGLYALYQLELRSGYLRRLTKNPSVGIADLAGVAPQRLFSIPGRQALAQVLGDNG